jgi:hypothetical protein
MVQKYWQEEENRKHKLQLKEIEEMYGYDESHVD